MRTDVLRATMAAAAVALLAAGCGSTTEGEPTAAGSDTATTTRNLDEIEIFNPCTELSDDALRAANLEPSTKRVLTDPPSGPATFRSCNWKSADRQFRVDVYSTSHTIDETRNRDDLVDLKEVVVGPRNGLTYFDSSDAEREICYVAFPAAQGMFNVSASWVGSGNQDVCALAVERAIDLEPYLPE
ncbi:DUF3558 domain-containing protein [Nocardia cyriacigeorgica]|uniref:DUF3558 domain-containing protein n=1 Tax=Nocardia cyriacigeorgica TaxID=135487 RepID=A0A6P1DDN7_9NOCA|nr:DUF3558 domain-containing protein [Nocardia cyriacigeorgica]NEW40439.1 DUF3558 domain-containing protein [Nocardia cyriacigeorgica]NEW46723.1 DUF3558 domain-containing protein [Nocardia cyriacigeorgica]